jgi:hypothetical protein
MPIPVAQYALFVTLTAVVVTVAGLDVSEASAQSNYPSGWKTDWENRSVDLAEIMSGGVPRDGIPSVDAPRFVSIDAAANWLGDREPVIMLQTGASARAYPLQIMTYHEIVNDELGGVPVTVTFCPLCYSAIAYRRTVGKKVYEFGVSGLLRHSDLIMYDRQTESLWQQIDGEAIVGDLTGTVLEPLPAQIVSFAQFAARFPDGSVLSRDTGHVRSYGTNPYRGYDDIDERPFLFRGDVDDRLPPMEKVVALSLGEQTIAYPHSVTRARRVINDMIDAVPLVIFHVDGAVTALGHAVIRDAEIIGTTGVFDRRVDGRTLSFEFEDGLIRDAETGSVWDVTGQAISGPLAGRSLQPIVHGNYFSFAWFAFQPGSQVYR